MDFEELSAVVAAQQKALHAIIAAVIGSQQTLGPVFKRALLDVSSELPDGVGKDTIEQLLAPRK